MYKLIVAGRVVKRLKRLPPKHKRQVWERIKFLEDNHTRPIMTLEAHKEQWIWQSLDVLSRSERFCRIVQTR